MNLATQLRPLLPRWPLWRRRPPAAAPLRSPMALPELTEDDAEAVDDKRPCGCGWFDSSHELSCGLLVREHASLDAVAAEMPLRHWLEFQLSGRCVVPAA